MAIETPVVATRVAGVPALLEHGKLGRLVEPASAETLATGIMQLALDENLRSCLAGRARRCIEDNYSFERRMQRVAAIYDRLLGRSVASPPEQQFLSV
jgi:glycosyltransferase involved in cell wall biosynthesis